MLAALREITGPILEGVLRFIPDKNKRAKARESFDSEMLGLGGLRTYEKRLGVARESL